MTDFFRRSVRLSGNHVQDVFTPITQDENGRFSDRVAGGAETGNGEQSPTNQTGQGEQANTIHLPAQSQPAISVAQAITVISATLDLPLLERLKAQLNQAKANGHATNYPTSYMANRTLNLLLKRVDSRKKLEPKIAILDVDHTQWTIDDLVQIYTLLFTEDTAAGNCASRCLALLQKGLALTFSNMFKWESLSIDVDDILVTENPAMSAKDQKTLIENMVLEMKKHNAPDKATHHAEAARILDKLRQNKHTTVKGFFDDILALLMENRLHVATSIDLGLMPPSQQRAQKLPASASTASSEQQAKKQKFSHAPAGKDPCRACGRDNHTAKECNFRAQNHPGCNSDLSKTFAESAAGIKWANFKLNGTTPSPRLVVPGNLHHDGSKFDFKFDKTQAPKKGTVFSTSDENPLPNILELNNLDITGYTLKVGVSLTNNPLLSREVDALIDTGSLRQDFISPTMAAWFKTQGADIERALGKDRCLVCSVKECTLVDTLVSFNLIYFNECLNVNETIVITAWVLPNLPYDLIVGRPTLERHRLLKDRKISLSGDAFSFHYDRQHHSLAAPSCSCHSNRNANTTADLDEDPSFNSTTPLLRGSFPLLGPDVAHSLPTFKDPLKLQMIGRDKRHSKNREYASRIAPLRVAEAFFHRSCSPYNVEKYTPRGRRQHQQNSFHAWPRD